MSKIIILFGIICLFVYNTKCIGANDDESPVIDYFQRVYKNEMRVIPGQPAYVTDTDYWRRWLAANPDAPQTGERVTISLSSWTAPISIVRMDTDSLDNVRISPCLGIGVGYLFAYGSGAIRDDLSLDFHPRHSFGFVTNLTVINSPDPGGEIDVGFDIGGLWGIKSLSLFTGYDFINSSFVISTVYRFDGFSFGDSYRVSKIKKD